METLKKEVEQVKILGLSNPLERKKLKDLEQTEGTRQYNENCLN